jgi:STE24 endopeptidase
VYAWWVLSACASVAAAVFVIAGLVPDPPVTSLAADPGVVGVLDRAAVPVDRVITVAQGLDFDQEVLADIAAYRTPRRAVALASHGLAFLVPFALAVLLTAPGGRRLLRPVLRLPGVVLPVAAVVAGAVIVEAVLRFPLSAWAGLVQDGTWGFRTRSSSGWLLDHLGVVAGRALLLGASAAGVVWLVRRHPQTWPARASVAVAVIGPLALLLHPLVVHPLLLPTGPLPEGPHREAVAALVARSGTPDVPVLVGEASLRTIRRNAVVTGLGPTQRIVLHDTLFALEPRQVASLAAHELAHVERRDPLRGVLAPVPMVLIVGLLVRRRLAGPPRDRPTEVRTLATAAVVVLALVAAATPLSAALSRTIEHRTDVRAVVLSGDPAAYVEMLRSFVIDGLADPDPPRWSVLLWGTHPPPSTRIGAALDAQPQFSGPIDLAMR